MTRRIYQNGFENGNIVPIGRSNASSFPPAPNNERNRFIRVFFYMHSRCYGITKNS